MSTDHETLEAVLAEFRLAVHEIAQLTFRRIDPHGDYLVCGRDRSTPFITARLIGGLPVNMVGHRDRGLIPAHDFGIYRITDEGLGHDEVARGWVPVLVAHQVGNVLTGDRITVEHIWANAYHEAIMRLEASSLEDG